MAEFPKAALLAAALLAAAGPARAEPALWSVTGGKATVFLFGSVHLLPEGGFEMPGRLADALADADRVCLEIDPDATDEAATASITLSRAVDPDGRDLFELLGDDADRVRARAEAAGVELEPLAMFEPWFAALMLSVTALQSHGYDAQHGVEQVIEAEAKKAGKAGCGLETLDGQLAMLDGLSGSLQTEVLLQAIDEAADIEAKVEPMVEAWRAGDVRGLERSVEEDFDDYPELADTLLYERNARWAREVAQMLEGDRNVLLVVGAMHLVGERGLPALLEKRGYRVERR
jgi:uncharacterized protein YbaP (TraB family)